MRNNRYRTPVEDQPGSWREVWELTVMVMGILAGPMVAVFGGILLLLAALWALMTEPILAAVPVGIMAGGFWLFVQHDKKARAALEAEISGEAQTREI